MYLGKEQAFKWRDEVEYRLIAWNNDVGRPLENVQIVTLNPCNRWIEKGGPFEAEGPFVVQMDKLEMAKSDVFIVNATNPGWGTPMEQYIGYTSGKMIICFSDCDFPSPWAKVHSHKMCRTHIEATKYLCDVAAKQLARIV
jgi:hypothetical protein